MPSGNINIGDDWSSLVASCLYGELSLFLTAIFPMEDVFHKADRGDRRYKSCPSSNNIYPWVCL